MSTPASSDDGIAGDGLAGVAFQSGIEGDAYPSEADAGLNFEIQLRDARALIKSSKLAGYGKFLAPFSKQFLTDVSNRFPQDKSVYDATDSVRKYAVRTAAIMRICTFLVFAIFVILSYLHFNTGFIKFGFDFGNLSAPGVGMVALVSTWFFAFIVRLFLRDRQLNAIGGSATSFANHFFKEISGIHDLTVKAVHNSHDDRMLKPGWPEKSAGWIEIALWLGRRYEFLDRHVTATCWKIEWWYRRMESGFRATKVLMATLATIYVIFIAERSAPFLYTIGSTAALAAVTLIVWARPGKSNSYWSDQFRVSIQDFDAKKDHVFSLVAKEVAADKKSIMGQLRNVSNEKDPN